MNKTKRMLKNAAISVGIGAVPAFVVLWLCNLFMKVNELTYMARMTMYKIRITMPLMIGITVMLFGECEKKSVKKNPSMIEYK